MGKTITLIKRGSASSSMVLPPQESKNSGAIVKRVYPSSPARAGIRDDDRIMAINGEAIATSKDLFAARWS